MVIIDGHDAWTAYKLKGEKEIPVKFLDVEGFQSKKQIQDIFDNPQAKGNKLLGESIKQIQSEQPTLHPAKLLDQAQGMAAEKQAQLTQASYLSKAKKKLVEGKEINQLPKSELNALLNLDEAATKEFMDDVVAKKTKLDIEKNKQEQKINFNKSLRYTRLIVPLIMVL